MIRMDPTTKLATGSMVQLDPATKSRHGSVIHVDPTTKFRPWIRIPRQNSDAIFVNEKTVSKSIKTQAITQYDALINAQTYSIEIIIGIKSVPLDA